MQHIADDRTQGDLTKDDGAIVEPVNCVGIPKNVRQNLIAQVIRLRILPPKNLRELGR